MKTLVFDKTDKGREEIATRTHHLPPRMRTLLLLVDGKQNAAGLMEKVAGLGLSEESIRELLECEFIRLLPAPHRDEGISSAEATPDTGHAKAPAPATQTQFQAVYRFYTETIRSTIGLRGYLLQLKVEKAASLDELRALREPYIDAVLKAKGNEVARSLTVRLDELLCQAPAEPMQD